MESNTTTGAKRINRKALAAYIAGFVLSVVLTVTAYVLVQDHTFGRRVLIGALGGLALTQFLVQLIFFLHLGTEPKPRWRLVVFFGMVVMVAILVVGSMWIMYNLNYHMSPSDMNNYLKNQDAL